MQEIWDAYDKNGNKLGFDLVRGEVVPSGVYHLVAEALVRHVDGDFLLMKRSPQKEKFAGFYEATAGGSALKGEDALQCVKRELKEETGVTAISYEEIAFNVFEVGSCLFHSFLAITDCEKDAVSVQEGETVGYKWVTEDEFIEFMEGGRGHPSSKKEVLRVYAKAGLGALQILEKVK